MKNCMGCKSAEWFKTKTGRLSPSGDGECKYKIKIPQLPNAYYWYGGDKDRGPTPFGGYINRKKNFQGDCPYYTRG